MKAWYLHSRMRKLLLAFLRELEGGRYLPRRRLVLTNQAEAAPGSRLPEHRPQPIGDDRHEDG
jgi:hypothetical protein